ncbi:MAG: hypothetical protein AAFN27_06425 [Pseudomonadota bacterium]
MADIKCVEPALATETDKSVVDVAAANDLVFPHVNSCLAIGCLLADGRALGAHVSMMGVGADAEMDPDLQGTLGASALVPMVAPSSITKVVFLGDQGTWKSRIGALRTILGDKHGIYYDNTDGDGVDLRISASGGYLSVCRYSGSKETLVYKTLAEISSWTAGPVKLA